MKKPHILFFSIVCLFLLNGNSDKPASLVNIKLNVDTKLITSLIVNDVCNFGQDPSIPNTDFLTEVALDDIVFWEGVSSSAPETDKVKVTLIKRDEGANLFGMNRLRDSDQNPGIVVGSVRNGSVNDTMKYSITFKVFNNDVLRGTFKIDPKLRVKG